MRLKHIKGAEELVANSSNVIKNPIDYKGKFKNIFKNDNPIYIEIGMGKGNFIIENAKRYKNINFIGIEKYDSVMVKAIKRLEEEKLDNIKLIRMDANIIDQIFEKEIDRIYLNFSDPWPKDRHAKRRLTSPNFLNKYKNLFKNKEQIIFKTDNRNLFEYSIISFNEMNYKIEDISLNLHEDDYPDNIKTEYEMKFSSMGYPIYMINVTK